MPIASPLFDLMPFPCLVTRDGRIETVNAAGRKLGFSDEPLDAQLGGEILALARRASRLGLAARVTDHECTIAGRPFHLSVTIQPYAMESGGGAVLFLDDITQLMETTDELARTVIDTEIVNRRLDRTVAVLSTLAHFGADLLQVFVAEQALVLLETTLIETRLFEDVRVTARGAEPAETDADAARAILAEGGPDAEWRSGRRLALPIAGRDTVHGFVSVRYAEGDDEAPLIDIKPFVAITAFTLDNIALYRDLLDSLGDLTLRNRVARALQESHSRGEIEGRLSALAHEHLSATWFRLVARGARLDESPEGMEELARLAFEGHAVKRALPGGAGLCVPVRLSSPGHADHPVHAALAVHAAGRAAFEDRVLELFLALADLVAIALRNLRMYDDLRAHNVAVQYLNEELAKTVVDLKAASEMKTRFVSTVSHEFRTPLTAITSYVETLIEAGETLEAETRRSFLEVVRDEAERLTRLINQLLELSRLQARDRPLAREPVSMRAIANRVAGMLKPVAERKRIRLEVTEGPHEGALLGDPDALLQVCLNLVGNGIRYTLPGGSVEIAVEEDERLIYTRVRDTGIGIPEDSLDAIFSEFYTVSQTRAKLAREADERKGGEETSAGTGTGLGLSIAKAIIERHGGRIGVSSNVGVGSEFIVTFDRRGGAA